MKVCRVVNRAVPAKRHIELAAQIETAKTVEAGAIEIIEKLRAFLRAGSTRADQLIEASAMIVKELLIITRFNLKREPAPNLFVKIDQMRIEIVQQCMLGFQPECDCETAAKGFDIATNAMGTPDGLNVGEQPTFAARPL